MDLGRAMECIQAARGDAIVAAWISILDEYNLPPHATVAPEDFWGTYEQFYCNDLIDADEFYHNEAAEKIRSGRRTIRPNKVHDALGRLMRLRSPKGIEMPTNPDDLFANPNALVSQPATNGGFLEHRPASGSLFAENNAAPAMALFHSDPSAEMLFDTRPPTFELPVPAQGQISALGCTNPTSGQPFDVQLNLQVTCCGRPLSVVKEDAKGLLDSAEYIPAEDSHDEHDVAEFVFHGRCEVCQTTVCASAVKPVFRGTMGPLR